MFFYIMKGMNNAKPKHKLDYSYQLDGRPTRKKYLWATLNIGTKNVKHYSGWSIKQIAYNYAQDHGWAKYKKLIATLEGLTMSEHFGFHRDDYDVFDPS